jgi:Zn-dependent peptidase ImmA (M78 family)/plasmid maintenance system antidote protein VapI
LDEETGGGQLMSGMSNIKPAELGSRLKAARASAKITQETAAQNIGVARTTIVAIEAGERQIKPAELIKLAEMYGITVNSLLRQPAVHFDLVPQFRRSVSAREDEGAAMAAARKLQDLASMSMELERLLGKSRRQVLFPEYKIKKANLYEQAEDLAAEIRGRLGLGLAPIADIFALAEVEFGIRLFIHKIDSKISGVFAFHEQIGGCVLLNSVHPLSRQAWTCAHELGHYLTDREAIDVSWSKPTERGVSEKFVDRFAGAFLMPAASLRMRYSEIREEAGKFTPRHLAFLARLFNVSLEAIARRLEQLGLVQSGTYEALVQAGLTKAVGAEGYLQKSPGPPWIVLLVLEAHERDILTEGQASEILGLDRLAFRELFDSLRAGSDVNIGGGDV